MRMSHNEPNDLFKLSVQMTSSYPSTQNASIEEMPVVFSTIEGVTKREVKRENILPNYPWEELR